MTKVQIMSGRRKMFAHPIFVSTRMEGNIVIAMEEAITEQVNGVRTRTDVLAQAVQLWLKTNKRTVPPIESGKIFDRKKGGKKQVEENPI